jgi:hypothetical protein
VASGEVEVQGVEGADAVDRAINRVLLAEREARVAVDACHGEAARIVADAENLSLGIGRRTEARIKAAHRIADRAVDRALHELLGPIAGRESKQGGTPDAARLERAVDVLVAEILGDTP